MSSKVYKNEYDTVTLDSGYDDLANAIILRALNDYCTAKLRLNDENFNNEFSKTGCERFVSEVPKFLTSEYFSILTDLDGKYLLQIADRNLKRGYEL